MSAGTVFKLLIGLTIVGFAMGWLKVLIGILVLLTFVDTVQKQRKQ